MLFSPSDALMYADIHIYRIFEDSVPFVSSGVPREGGVTLRVIFTPHATWVVTPNLCGKCLNRYNLTSISETSATVSKITPREK